MKYFPWLSAGRYGLIAASWEAGPRPSGSGPNGRRRGPQRGGVEVATGTVKWFSDQKGYGFIVPDDGGKDLFVHFSNMEGEGFKTLQEGQKVEFEPAEGKKGPEATKVRPVG